MIQKILLILLAVPLMAASSLKQKSARSRVVIKHRESGGVGYQDGYTSGGVFLAPLWRHDCLPFLDVRAHVMNDGRFAFNAGGGLRSPLTEMWAFGINAYYDYRNAADLSPGQVGAGLEVLGDILDVRLNGYVPIGDDSFFKRHLAKLNGQGASFKEEAQAALPVIEAELGAPFTDPCGKIFVYAAAGSYYLFSKDVKTFHLGSAWGGKARLASTFSKFLELELSASYDKIFHTNVQGVVAFHLPLGPRNLSHLTKGSDVLCDKLTQPIIRNEIIPIEDPEKEVPFLNPLTNEPAHFIVLGKHAASLEEAEKISQSGDIIYIENDINGQICLKPKQILQSSAMPLVSGEGYLPPLQTTRPRIGGVVLADQTVVSGFEIARPIGLHSGHATVLFSKMCVDVGGASRARLDIAHCQVGPSQIVLEKSADYILTMRNNFLKSFEINAKTPMHVLWTGNNIDPPDFENVIYVTPQP